MKFHNGSPTDLRVGYNLAMMERMHLSATTLTPRVQRWLQKPAQANVLHLFDAVINLIDAEGEIVSIVQPQVQSGPFSLLVRGERPFPQLISPRIPVHKTATSLIIGPLEIDCCQATLWQPIPNWQLLCKNQSGWRDILPKLETAVTNHLNSLSNFGPANFITQFQTAVAEMQSIRLATNLETWQTAVSKLAGLGPGFTPAGDDFLVGFLFGLWATRPKDEVEKLAKIVVETAVPRTTQLSAAWLQAAGRGEAWLPWHELGDALGTGHNWQTPVQRILNQGATSGIAALLGFIAAA